MLRSKIMSIQLIMGTVSIIFTFLFLSLSAYASSDKAISGEATYYGSRVMSMSEARERALIAAQSNALSKEFGTLVTQNIMQNSEILNDKESQSFLLNTESSVRGEWISTIGKPQFNESFENGCPVVTCKIEGWGRKLSNKAPDINIKVLGAPDKRAVRSDFKAKEDIFVYVESPSSDVYIIICMLDENGTVYKMFPYEDTAFKLASFKKGQEYVLFDTSRNYDNFGTPTPLWITAEKFELNKIYAIYSPNYFSRGNWQYDSQLGLEVMAEKDFNKWLLDLRRADDEMGAKLMIISVSPNDSNKIEYE